MHNKQNPEWTSEGLTTAKPFAEILPELAEKVREHSRKPDQMRADIVQLFDGPYVELFARWGRAGRLRSMRR